jgi:hypothetical protein
MNLENIFSRLWKDYISQNPSAGKIHRLFTKEGEKVVNDHIAFRTLDFPEIDIDVVAKPFLINGYVPKSDYVFTDKHLFARHYEHKERQDAPRIFISQLILAECSAFVQDTLKSAFAKTDHVLLASENLIFSGTLFKPLSYEIYNRLRDESEYAAWFYVFGFRANHFTVSINSLKKFNSIVSVNELLKSNGFVMNSSGGEIKGTPQDLLQQSSTIADTVDVNFEEGKFEVPCCYYEFAQRYSDPSGQIYSGFIAKSADKIFESTNFYTKKQ